jgi:hypothetical protein
MFDQITVDHSERERARRFKILEGAKFNLEEARDLWCWVNTGMTVKELHSFKPIVHVDDSHV